MSSSRNIPFCAPPPPSLSRSGDKYDWQNLSNFLLLVLLLGSQHFFSPFKQYHRLCKKDARICVLSSFLFFFFLFTCLPRMSVFRLITDIGEGWGRESEHTCMYDWRI